MSTGEDVERSLAGAGAAGSHPTSCHPTSCGESPKGRESSGGANLLPQPGRTRAAARADQQDARRRADQPEEGVSARSGAAVSARPASGLRCVVFQLQLLIKKEEQFVVTHRPSTVRHATLDLAPFGTALQACTLQWPRG